MKRFGETILREGEGTGTGGAGDPPAMPAGLDAAFWNADKGELNVDALNGELKTLREFKTAAEPEVTALAERRKGVPAKPEEYPVELPADFQRPEGFEAHDFTIDPKDPLLAEARTFAKEAGLTKAEFGKLLGMRARMEIASIQATKAAAAERMTALGDKASERYEAVKTRLKALAGDDLGTAMADDALLNGSIEIVEKLLEKGGGGFNRGGSDGESGGSELSDEEWDKMTPAEKLNYTAKHGKKAAA